MIQVQPVVMAGGCGTRPWPLSCPDRSQEFLGLPSGRTAQQQGQSRRQDLLVAGTASAASLGKTFIFRDMHGAVNAGRGTRFTQHSWSPSSSTRLVVCTKGQRMTAVADPLDRAPCAGIPQGTRRSLTNAGLPETIDVQRGSDLGEDGILRPDATCRRA